METATVPTVVTAAERTTPSRIWTIVFWAVAVATALPLFATRYPPLTDVPEHVAVIATLARLLPGGGGAPYEVAAWNSQYLLFHAAGALLARAVGDAVLANKLLFALVAVMWPVSMRSLLRALGRDERLAIFAAMVFWNRATIVGLEPYVASVPLAVFALAMIVRQVRETTWARGAAIAVLALCVFYTHASSYLLYVLTAAAVAFGLVVQEGRPHGLRRAGLALVALVPSGLAASAWWHAGSLTHAGSQPAGVDRMRVTESLSAMPIWTFDVWQTHFDEICAGAWWVAYGMVVVASWRRRSTATPEPRVEWLPWVPFACAATLYLTTPFRIGGAAMLNVRLAPVLTLFALLGLRLRKDRLGTIPLAIAASAALLMAGNAAHEIRAVAREKVGDLDVILAAMKPGTRVASLNFDRSSRRTHFWPYVFAGSYHRARGGAVASYSFVELPHWPVHYARGSAPPDHGPFWAFRPCAYRYREDGAFYDYVLVQGAVDPWDSRQGSLGPLFVPIARAGVFTLYEKAAGEHVELEPDQPDRGPCRER
jgi:hypothetical protein